MTDQFQLYIDALPECGLWLYKAYAFRHRFGPSYGVVLGRGQYLYSATSTTSLLEALTRALRNAEADDFMKPREDTKSDKTFNEIMDILNV